MTMKRITAAALAAVCLATAPLTGFAKEQPDATIDLSEGSVGIGVGYSWGKGTLHYQGQSIPVTVKGLGVGKVGASKVSASGEVYHLTSLADFDGNYTAAAAGATLGGGGAVTAMQNQNGVVIKMRSTTQGVDLNLSVDGVAFKLQR
jgi:hypothetical protein